MGRSQPGTTTARPLASSRHVPDPAVPCRGRCEAPPPYLNRVGRCHPRKGDPTPGWVARRPSRTVPSGPTPFPLARPGRTPAEAGPTRPPHPGPGRPIGHRGQHEDPGAEPGSAPPAARTDTA
ncbi:hypothetical protein GCM10010405_54890 [Streptomyces macrosporus]|uniref:Uncharacterized protein n=1 Tax=Streptomyces macrosporus TaxID=44032 RepID=A0ABP5XRW6_9ACTN